MSTLSTLLVDFKISPAPINFFKSLAILFIPVLCCKHDYFGILIIEIICIFCFSDFNDIFIIDRGLLQSYSLAEAAMPWVPCPFKIFTRINSEFRFQLFAAEPCYE